MWANWVIASLVVVTLAVSAPPAPRLLAQPSPPNGGVASIIGTVHTSRGEPLAGASVIIQGKNKQTFVEAKTGSDGTFVCSSLHPALYVLTVLKSGFHGAATQEIVLSAGERKQVLLRLEAVTDEPKTALASTSGMQ